MDALALDFIVQILGGLSTAFLVWGGWLCIGGAAQAPHPGATEHAEARFS